MCQSSFRTTMLRTLCALSALLLVSTGICCSSSSTDVFKDRKPVHPVNGQVFVNDKPAKGAFVLFIPVNEPANTPDPRPRAEVTENGSFAVDTYDSADGAPAGDYVVTIQWPGGVAPDGSEEPSDKLMGRYSDPATSQLRVTVKEGQNELPPFKLK